MHINSDIIFPVLWFLVMATILVIFYTRGKKALAIFPAIDTVTIKYRDKYGSGYSKKSFMSRRGGASKVLDIVVTDKELWLKSSVLFAGVGSFHDLVHKIPLDKITGTERNGARLTVSFITNERVDNQVVLVTKDIEAFLRAIKKR